ncbi:MAG TPA: hypothetical protein ENK25_11480 [Bacteroidetes bacterium]|nr:hypothetical protein [Bacteroidota bacterium]
MIKIVFRITAIAGLLLTLIPPILRYMETMTEDVMTSWVLVGTVIWFIGATPWLGRKKEMSHER